MACSLIATSLLLAALLTLGYPQQYEGEEPGRVWHPSRVQRTQSSSLFGNVQSSPQVPRRQGVQDRYRVQNAARNVEIPVGGSPLEQQRLRPQVSRGRASSRRTQQPIVEAPTAYEETPIERFSAETPSNREVVPEDNRNRLRSRKPVADSGESDLLLTLGDPRFKPTPRRQSSYETPTVDEDEGNFRKKQQIEPFSRRGSSEILASNGELPSRAAIPARPSPRTATVSLIPGRPPGSTASRTLPRRGGSRGGASLKPQESQFAKPVDATPENEVFKTPRTRGRFSNSFSTTTSEEPTIFETAATERSTLQSSTSLPLETVQIPNEPSFPDTEPTPRTTSRRFQRPSNVPRVASNEDENRSTERTLTRKFPSRKANNLPPSPPIASRPQLFRPDHTRQTSKEETGFTGRLSSREETVLPEQDNAQVTVTTEGYTEVQSEQSKQKGSSRGRARATTEQTSRSSSGQRPISRGEKKAKLENVLKGNDDEISEEDNYPKEFIEKIKSSAEKTQDAKNKLAPKALVNSKLGRARSLPLQQSRPAPKRRQTNVDSDVSESIHEEIFEQELPVSVKPKEVPIRTRNRYYGKAKTSTTTTSTTTTTVEPPLRSAPKAGQPSSVDVLRQRYRDKLKQSQEERQQKLASMRPKLLKEGVKASPDYGTSGSDEVQSTEDKQTSFKPTSRFSRPAKSRFEPKAQSGGTPGRFRPRFSLTPREPDSAVEPATPTVAEHARTRNRYSRLRKEELSVETPEAKTSWIRNSDKPKREDSAYKFIRLRTKDLTPLASEDVMESVINNEVLDVLTTTTSTEVPESSSAEVTTPAVEEAVATEANRAETVMTTTVASSAEVTTEAALRETTVQDQVTVSVTPVTVTVTPVLSLTEAPEAKLDTAMPSQQGSASTRHRFSSRYNGSVMTTSASDNSSAVTELPTLEDETPASTLSVLNLFASSLSSDSSTSSSAPLSEVDTTLEPMSSSVATEASSSIPTTEATTTTTVRPTTTTKRVVTTKKKNKAPKTTTVAPGFLENRPILRNIVSLFASTTTTTKKPKTDTKANTKTTKPKQKSKATTSTTKSPSTTTTTSTPSTTTTVDSMSSTSESSVDSSSVSPLPLAVSAEEIINSTQEVISNKTSFPSSFSKVPRDELDAFTPLPFVNTTSVANETTTESMVVPRVAGSTTEDTQNVTSQPVFFEYSPSTSTTTPRTTTTTPSTTTAGDYYVYGIYPNNTVVKKRAWKTFDYEKYMSPYVIFGIYPNNTIVRKFPNGTIINDEFMTSDNEIGDSSPSTSTSTTEAPSSSTTTTTEPPVSATTTEASVSGTATTTEASVSGTATTTEASSSGSATEVSGSSTVTTTEVPSGNSATTEDSGSSVTVETTSSPTEEATIPSDIEDVDDVTFSLRSSISEDDTTESPSSPSTTSGDFSESSGTTESPSSATEDSTFDVDFYRSGDISGSTTPMTSTIQNSEETTVDPVINQVLPLISNEEVQSLWSGNFSDSAGTKSMDNAMSSSIKIGKSANLLSGSQQKEIVSLTNIAFRALSTSGTSTTTRDTTTEQITVTPSEGTTRKPRVKFVTLTPGVLVTTDLQDEDAITLSSQHVQKVTKAPTQIPDDLLTSVFGSLEEKASSPIPDILKDVGNKVEGDGLTAALARRIIALAMERAKSTTTESVGTTLFSTTTDAATTTSSSTTTVSPTIPPSTTIKTTKPPKKKQSTRTTKGPSNAATDASQQNPILSLPVGTDLQDVLQKLLLAQNLEAVAARKAAAGPTTIKAPADMEKAVENQIRLAEEVRKASRTMKKKKKKVRTTTQAPPFNLGFLFNFFNRPSPTPAATRTAKKVKAPSTSAQPASQVLLLTSLPSAVPEDLDVTSATDASDIGDNGDSGDTGDSKTRGQLLTAAIDVTKAVSKFMGTVINNAAQSFQTFMRGGWGR